MDRQQLMQRRQELEAQFNSLRTQTDELRGKVEANETEMVKLQGAFAEVGKLLESLPSDTSIVSGDTPQAAVINAEPADEQETPKGESNATRRPKG